MITDTKAATGAEKRAMIRANKLAAAGWEVTVTVRDMEPDFYSDGSQMTSGFCMVHMHAGRETFDGNVSGHWRTTTRPTEGNRKTTRYIGGEKHQFASGFSALASEQALDIWISVLCVVERTATAVKVVRETQADR